MAHLFANGLLLSAVLGLLTACNDTETRQQIDIEGKTMGTFYSVKISGATPPNPHQLQQEIDALLEQANDDISTYRQTSVLSRFNQYRGSEPQPIPRGMADIILQAQRIGRDTDGAMNITIGPLVNLWGFGPEKQPTQIPTQDQIDSARQQVGLQHLTLISDNRGEWLRKDLPDLYVDLSTMGEGYGVDLLVNLMMQKGITNYLVSVGARSLPVVLMVRGSHGVSPFRNRQIRKMPCRRWLTCKATASALQAVIATILSKEVNVILMCWTRPPAALLTIDWCPPQ